MKKIHFFSKRSYSKLVLESDFQQHHLLGFQKHWNPSVLHCAVQLYRWGCAKVLRFKKKATTCPPNSSRTCVALSSEVSECWISFSWALLRTRSGGAEITGEQSGAMELPSLASGESWEIAGLLLWLWSRVHPRERVAQDPCPVISVSSICRGGTLGGKWLQPSFPFSRIVV